MHALIGNTRTQDMKIDPQGSGSCRKIGAVRGRNMERSANKARGIGRRQWPWMAAAVIAAREKDCMAFGRQNRETRASHSWLRIPWGRVLAVSSEEGNSGQPREQGRKQRERYGVPIK